MSKDPKAKDEEHDSLSEEQRIELLEKSVSTNKVALLIVALTIVVALSVTITTTIVSSMADETVYATPEELAVLATRIEVLEKTLAEKDAQIAQLTKAYPSLAAKLEASSAPTFQKVMLDQESSIQRFLKSMKAGMYDLAHMIPGSRTWLEHYNDQMDSAMLESQNRARDLKRLQTGEVLIEPDAR